MAPEQQEMEERKRPALFRFEQPNDVVSGTLMAVDQVTIEEKPVTQFIIRQPDGEFILINATWDVARKLHASDKGRFVEITFLGENKAVKKGENYLREFKVRVSKGAPLEITDEDIPF
jgi:hypothetical protein